MTRGEGRNRDRPVHIEQNQDTLHLSVNMQTGRRGTKWEEPEVNRACFSHGAYPSSNKKVQRLQEHFEAQPQPKQMALMVKLNRKQDLTLFDTSLLLINRNLLQSQPAVLMFHTSLSLSN